MKDEELNDLISKIKKNRKEWEESNKRDRILRELLDKRRIHKSKTPQFTPIKGMKQRYGK